jgi:ACR3 family arsenite efflux pump ArsB
MFKSLISIFLYEVVLPAILIIFACLWLYFLPEYWWGLMLATVIAIFWFFPLLAEKFDKYD